MAPKEASRTTRKRTRAGNAEDEDLPSGKKARLDATPSTTTDATDTPTRRRKSSALGAKAAVVAVEPNASDSVYDLPVSADKATTHDTPTKKTRRSLANRTTRSVYDVPESDDELSTPIVGNIESATASRKQASANGSTSERRGRSVKGVESESAKLSRDELGSSLPNDSAPSPAGSKQQRRSSKATENETLDATEQRIAPGTINGSATKGRRRPIKATETQTSEPVDKEPAPTAKPTKPAKPAKKPSIWEIRRALTRGLPIDAALAAYAAPVPDENEPRTSNPDSTPSGRKRHLDKEPGGETPPLKGILTPSRRDGTPRTRKSVAFDSGGDKGREVFFEDLPSKSTAKKAVKSPKELPKTVTAGLSEPDSAVDDDAEMQDREDEDEEIDEEIDEEVCSICKKPDSKPPNEILFCDGCDMAFHQRCYDVPTIPVGDWLCRNCTQDGDMIIPKDGSSKISALSGQKTEQAPGIPNFEQHLRAVTRVLIDRCTGRRVLPLQGQDEAYEKAFQLVEQTVLAGEGNSMLVIGARGSGKTTLVESIVSKMAVDHKDEFHVVRLNGFIHTDDKIALKEIWRQLGKEMDVEDDLINRTNNYADTLASLLAVLSHPSEILDTQQGVTSKSVIFIIDEFDLFATHARQTLLYNLFDIAQARKAPIAVLGLTTRIDVVESLEKRVKSRFSHRYVYLSLAKSLPAFWDICRHGLAIDADGLRSEGIDTAQKGLDEFLQWWNARIDALHKDPQFQDHLEYHFHCSKSVSAFLTTCVLPMASLSPASLSLKSHFTNPTARTALDAPDSKLHLLSSLADLDLSMLIAAARLDIVAHTDTVNFAMAYDEYTSLMGRQRVQSASAGLLALGGGARVWGRGVAGVSWERLVALGLLVPAGFAGRGGGGAGVGGGGLEGKMWKVDVALEEIPGCVKLSQVLGRWCREI